MSRQSHLPRIVHILPTYNEVEMIEDTLNTYDRDVINKDKKHQHLILVADDNSPDGTDKIVTRLANKRPHITLISGPRKGLGEALIRAYHYAVKQMSADIIIPNDADLQYEPKDALKLLAALDRGYDVAVASRHVPGGEILEGWSWFRRLNHFVSNSLMATYLAGVSQVKDHTGNFKAIRVNQVLDQVPLKTLDIIGYGIQLQILYELSKVTDKFVEIPVKFHPRMAGNSKVVMGKTYFRDVFEYITGVLKIRLDRNREFARYLVVGGTSFIINFIVFKLLNNWFDTSIVATGSLSYASSSALANTIGAEIAIIYNYNLSNLWTFKDRSIAFGKTWILKFIQFNLTSLGAVVISSGMIALLIHLFGPDYRDVYFFLSMILVVIYNYTVYSRIIWKKR